jgi:hypothetical protein
VCQGIFTVYVMACSIYVWMYGWLASGGGVASPMAPIADLNDEFCQSRQDEQMHIARQEHVALRDGMTAPCDAPRSNALLHTAPALVRRGRVAAGIAYQCRVIYQRSCYVAVVRIRAITWFGLFGHVHFVGCICDTLVDVAEFCSSWKLVIAHRRLSTKGLPWTQCWATDPDPSSNLSEVQ